MLEVEIKLPLDICDVMNVPEALEHVLQAPPVTSGRDLLPSFHQGLGLGHVMMSVAKKVCAE